MENKPTLDQIIKVWEKTIDVQMHFNDLELRIRNFAISYVGILLGIIGFTFSTVSSINVFGLPFPLSSLITLFALFGWIAFYIMDRHWYHRLLYGAVKQGEEIEKKLKDDFPDIGLTLKISKESHNRKILWFIPLNSKSKMDLFYGLVSLGLIALFITFYFGTDSSKIKTNSNVEKCFCIKH